MCAIQTIIIVHHKSHIHRDHSVWSCCNTTATTIAATKHVTNANKKRERDGERVLTMLSARASQTIRALPRARARTSFTESFRSEEQKVTQFVRVVYCTLRKVERTEPNTHFYTL